MHNRTQNRAAWIWLLVIPVLLLAALLAARSLNVDAIWYDEYWSLKHAGSPPYEQGSLIDIWNFNRTTNLWEPPGYYLLLNEWGRLAGWSVFAARTYSLLFGLLAVAMTYRLGRDLFSPLVGLSAVVALGTSALFIDYLHEIRNYTPFVLTMAFICWAYWRIITGRAGRWLQAGFVVSVAAFLYLHYYAVVPLAAIALYHLLFVPKGREWWRVVILMGLGGALFLPWIGGTLKGLAQASGGANYIVPTLTVEQSFRVLLHAFSNGSVALLALLAAITLGTRQRAAWFVWFCIVAIFALMMLVNAWLEILIHIRHLLALWPLLALVVGVGVTRLAKGGIHPALPLSIWILVGIGAAVDPAFVADLPNTEPKMDRAALEATVSVLQDKAAAADVIVLRVPAGDKVMGYYLHDIPAAFKETGGFYDAESHYHADEFIDEAAHVWYMSAPGMPPFYDQQAFLDALNARHVYCDAPVDLPEMRLERYTLIPDEPGAYQFGDGIRLTLLDPLPDVAHENLSLLLGWTLSDDVPRQVYSVGLHVENADGELVAQADYGLPGDPFNCAASDILLEIPPPIDDSGFPSSGTGQNSDRAPVHLPPGEYTLLALVYDWQTGERLPAVNTDSGESGERLVLGTFWVENL